MRNRFRVNFTAVIVGLTVLVLTISGCATAETPQATSQPNGTGLQANFTAVQPGVKLFKGGSEETVVAPDQPVTVQLNDRIEVDSEGRGFLRFPDSLEVELFRNAILIATDAKQESGGSIFIRLNQLKGQIGVALNEQSLVRVTLETEDSTLSTLEEGTQFLVCKAPGKLTCLQVLKGSVEVVAQGEKQVINEGEATFILAGQPAKPAICSPNDQFIIWQDEIRRSADTPSISDIVASLPQQPCSQATSQTSTYPGSDGMVKIDAGAYQVGSSQANEYHNAAQDITLDSFWIDIYEVTNARYQQYLDQTGSPPPAVWPGEAEHPVRGVTWDQADAYCTWAKKRLPSEAEWEVAGRGPGPNAPIFPWGSNDPDAGGNINQLPVDNTYPVGAYSFNVSPFGLYDLVGNVWEWVREPYDNRVPAGLKLLRGGRFGYIQDLSFRQPAESNDQRFVPYAGFRCAADQVE
jgi:formylglycine-generating enzyme required for sulfatase activity